jgi:AraC-like DNA-binding protein
MSYDHAFLFQRILFQMMGDPCISVQSMARELKVSRRTIQGAIESVAKKSYRALRQEILITKAVDLFSSDPSLAVKQVSFAVGFTSPRSFARAIRKASGMSPEELRSHILLDKGRLANDIKLIAEKWKWG